MAKSGKKGLAPGQPSAKTGTDRRGDSSILQNGKLGQFWWCFKATINGDAGHFPTPRNGHFPTRRFGHFPTPRNGPTPRFGHFPTPKNGHFPTRRFGHFPTPRNGPTPRFGHFPTPKNGHFSTQLRKIKRGILTAAKILRNVAKKEGMLALLGTFRRTHELLHLYAIYFLNG